MAKRRYDQYCGLARALDRVGERWTLLVIRELLLGPKRYTDLLEALPGIGTNRLAIRLRELVANDVVARRRLQPPAASTVYELTAYGRELEPAVISLTRWGGRWLGRPKRGEHFRPAWLAIAMRAAFQEKAAAGVRESYEFRIDGEVLDVSVDEGVLHVGHTFTQGPDLTITMSTKTLLTLMSGQLALTEAVRRGKAQADGGQEALEHCTAIFALKGRGETTGQLRQRTHAP